MKRIHYRISKSLCMHKLSLVIGICFIANLFQYLSAQHTIFTIENCVNTFTKANVIPTQSGYQYWFVAKEFANGKILKMSTVAPGKSTHAPHTHQEDEFFYVLEGKAAFFLEGEEVIVEANTSLYCPSNTLHGIRNVGITDLKYLVIKEYEN
ncbi:cupin domain-containing protein [Aquimarina sp. W85]|uniref:cupin domain-containing protein n=1 Tax=Aquimarina rhodophyticola TaxID=3342246 RepID=UPI00366B262B